MKKKSSTGLENCVFCQTNWCSLFYFVFCFCVNVSLCLWWLSPQSLPSLSPVNSSRKQSFFCQNVNVSLSLSLSLSLSPLVNQSKLFCKSLAHQSTKIATKMKKQQKSAWRATKILHSICIFPFQSRWARDKLERQSQSEWNLKKSV